MDPPDERTRCTTPAVDVRPIRLRAEVAFADVAALI
jgi:hypothetical protein